MIVAMDMPCPHPGRDGKHEVRSHHGREWCLACGSQAGICLVCAANLSEERIANDLSWCSSDHYREWIKWVGSVEDNKAVPEWARRMVIEEHVGMPTSGKVPALTAKGLARARDLAHVQWLDAMGNPVGKVDLSDQGLLAEVGAMVERLPPNTPIAGYMGRVMLRVRDEAKHDTNVAWVKEVQAELDQVLASEVTGDEDFNGEIPEACRIVLNSLLNRMTKRTGARR